MFFEKYKCEVETLSPTHIGDGDKLLPADYIFYQGKIHVIDFDKLYDALQEKHLIERFIEYIEKGAGGLWDFLEENRLFSEKKLEELSRRSLAFISSRKESDSVATCVKDAYGQPYIPGSEVKGAVRNALLYQLLARDAHIRGEVLQKLRRGELKRGDIDQYLRPIIKDAKGDLGRLIKFSDSGPVRSLAVAGAYRVSTALRDVVPLTLVEVIPPGNKTSMELTICLEERLIRMLGDRVSINTIIEACNAKSRAVIGLERARISRRSNSSSSKRYEEVLKHLDDFYQRLQKYLERRNSDEALLRIGGGQGLYSTTILPALIIERRFIEALSLRPAPPFRKNRKKGDYRVQLRRLLTPFTRRPFNVKVALIDGSYMPFGWMRMVFERC